MFGLRISDQRLIGSRFQIGKEFGADNPSARLLKIFRRRKTGQFISISLFSGFIEWCVSVFVLRTVFTAGATAGATSEIVF